MQSDRATGTPKPLTLLWFRLLLCSMPSIARPHDYSALKSCFEILPAVVSLGTCGGLCRRLAKPSCTHRPDVTNKLWSKRSQIVARGQAVAWDFKSRACTCSHQCCGLPVAMPKIHA